jgi:hypothetical protein
MSFTFEGLSLCPSLPLQLVLNQVLMSGTAIAIWGNNALVQGFRVQIDNNSAYNTSSADPTPQTYSQWYQSPVLKDGQHNMNLSRLHGEAVDFMIITPGPQTRLDGQILIVDDSYSGINYYGSGWKEVHDTRYRNLANILVNPFQNRTHQTSNEGDGFSFSYSGQYSSSFSTFFVPSY